MTTAAAIHARRDTAIADYRSILRNAEDAFRRGRIDRAKLDAIGEECQAEIRAAHDEARSAIAKLS